MTENTNTFAGQVAPWAASSQASSSPAAPLTTKVMNAPSGADLAPGSTANGSYQYSEPSVISTENGQKVLKSAVDTHNQDMVNLRTATDAKTTTPDASKTWAMQQVGGVTADEAKASGLDLSQYNYDAESGYFLPLAGSKSQQDQFSNDKKVINDAFSTQMANMDAATRSLIDSIKGIYSDRIAAQADVNRRELQGFNTMNLRDGTSRYAGGVAQSILTADENAGLDRIAKIAHEESGLLASANENLTNKKYTAFMDDRAAIDKLTAERSATLKDLQTKAIAYQTKQRDEVKAATRDSAISTLMEQGITDPTAILKSINAKGGQYSAKEVKDALTNLSPTDKYKDLSASTRDFFIMKEKNLLPDSVKNLPEGQQLLAYLRQEKQAVTIGKATSPTTGTNPTPNEISDATAIFSNLDPKWGNNVMGPDGRVDPYIYRRLYDHWITPKSLGGLGHTPASFLKSFPINTHIDPHDMELPILAPIIPNKKPSTTQNGA